jgi:hypothetical protein
MKSTIFWWDDVGAGVITTEVVPFVAIAVLPAENVVEERSLQDVTHDSSVVVTAASNTNLNVSVVSDNMIIYSIPLFVLAIACFRQLLPEPQRNLDNLGGLVLRYQLLLEAPQFLEDLGLRRDLVGLVSRFR